MKEILQRLFRHEELTRSESCQVMKDITRGDCPDVQIAALLTAFSMSTNCWASAMPCSNSVSL